MTIFQILLYLHIAFGGLSFLVGMLVLFMKKGNQNHKQLGNFFFYLLLSSALISMPMSVLHTNYFLFIVGVFTAYMLVSGRRYITIKSVNDVKKIDFMMAIIMFLFGLAFVVFGIFKLVCNNNFGIVLLVFGTISFGFVAQDYKNFTKLNLDRNTYLRSHISRMVGAYIASVTAFLVTNNYFLPSVIAWLLPSIVLVPLIIIWISKFAPKTK